MAVISLFVCVECRHVQAFVPAEVTVTTLARCYSTKCLGLEKEFKQITIGPLPVEPEPPKPKKKGKKDEPGSNS